MTDPQNPTPDEAAEPTARAYPGPADTEDGAAEDAGTEAADVAEDADVDTADDED